MSVSDNIIYLFIFFLLSPQFYKEGRREVNWIKKEEISQRTYMDNP